MEVLSYAAVFNADSLVEPCCELLRCQRDLIATDRFKKFQKDHFDMGVDVIRKLIL